MILIGVRTDDVTEEPQTPEHDRLSDRRLSRSQAYFLIGNVGSERDSQNVSEAPLVERVESLAGPHLHISEPYSKTSRM